MRILVIWFLDISEMLHASPLLRDLEAIAESGHDMVCIFPVAKKVTQTSRKNLRIEVIHIWESVPIISHVYFCLLAFLRLIKRYKDTDTVVFGIDVIPFILPFLWLYLFFVGKPRPVFTIRETSPIVETRSTGRHYMHIYRYLSLRLSRYSDAVFAISPMRAKEIVTKYRIPEHQVHVWPSSVDTRLFDPSKYTQDRQKIRDKLQLDDKFILIYHGDLSEERGLDALVEAISLVHQKRRDVAVLFLGKGRAEHGLRRLVKSFKLDSAVIFHPPVRYDEVPRLIAAADAGVIPLPDQPQWRYQVPLKLIEYLAMEKIVIVTDLPGHRWIIGRSRAAFYCGQGRPDQISEAILRCLSNKDSNRRSIRQQVAERFSSHSVVARILQILFNCKPIFRSVHSVAHSREENNQNIGSSRMYAPEDSCVACVGHKNNVHPKAAQQGEKLAQ